MILDLYPPFKTMLRKSFISAMMRTELFRQSILRSAGPQHVTLHQEIRCDGQMVPAIRYWETAKMLRSNRRAREKAGECIVGGMDSTRFLVEDLKVLPKVVFLRSDLETPSWMNDLTVIRCTGAEVQLLLSSSRCNDVAAAFDTPPRIIPESLFDPNPAEKLKRVLVLTGLRIPSNLGSLIRMARLARFDLVITSDGCDALNEKCLRASGGAAFDQKQKIVDVGKERLVPLLQRLSKDHRLLPLLFSPGEDTTPIAQVSRSFHGFNHQRRLAGEMEVGCMLVLGGESSGLKDLVSAWGDFPMKHVKLPMDNAQSHSLNVKSAGSIALSYFSHFPSLGPLVEPSGSDDLVEAQVVLSLE